MAEVVGIDLFTSLLGFLFFIFSPFIRFPFIKYFQISGSIFITRQRPL